MPRVPWRTGRVAKGTGRVSPTAVPWASVSGEKGRVIVYDDIKGDANRRISRHPSCGSSVTTRGDIQLDLHIARRHDPRGRVRADGSTRGNARIALSALAHPEAAVLQRQ